MLAILAPFMPLIASLLTKWMEKSASDAELKRLATEFIRIFQERGLMSVNLHKEDEKQREELEKGQVPIS